MGFEGIYKVYGRNFHVEPASSQYVNCVLQDEYGIRVLAKENIQFILDIGAHVGSFTVMAHEMWPKAKIIAVEPHPESFENLCRNTSHIPQETLLKINAAITGHSGKCHLSSSVSHSRVGEYVTEIWDKLSPRFKDFSIEVNALSSEDLINKLLEFGMTQVDLLKLDCEGGEYELLPYMASSGFLQHVGWIRGEWHCRDKNDFLQDAMAETHVANFNPNHPHEVGLFVAHRR